MSGRHPRGQQHIAHRHMARMDALELEHAADVAAALRHAARDWKGDDEVAHWLEARAEHVEQVGRYDTETRPSTAGWITTVAVQS